MKQEYKHPSLTVIALEPLVLQSVSKPDEEYNSEEHDII